MRFLKLDLLAWGPFTDVSLDLSGGNQGLHVVYGPSHAFVITQWPGRP